MSDVEGEAGGAGRAVGGQVEHGRAAPYPLPGGVVEAQVPHMGAAQVDPVRIGAALRPQVC